MAKREHGYTKNDQIFNDLEDYLIFCKTFGYRYDESELYSQRSFVYRQYQKWINGKEPKNMWDQDSKTERA